MLTEADKQKLLAITDRMFRELMGPRASCYRPDRATWVNPIPPDRDRRLQAHDPQALP